MPEAIDLEKFLPQPPPPPPDPRKVVDGGLNLIGAGLEAPKRLLDSLFAGASTGAEKIIEAGRNLRPGA